MIINSRFIRLIIFILFIFTSGDIHLYSGNKNTQNTTVLKPDSLYADSTQINVMESLEKLFVDEVVKQNNEKRIQLLREEKLNSINNKLDDIRSYISRGIDTVKYRQFIMLGQSVYSLTSDIQNNGDVNTVTPRNLTTSMLLNKEIIKDLEIVNKELTQKISETVVYRKSLDSLVSDTILFKIPKDSVKAGEYFIMLGKLALTINPVDSALVKNLDILNQTKDSISILLTRLNENVWYIENIRSTDELSPFSGNLFRKNYPFIWNNPEFNRSFGEAVNYSNLKNIQILIFYLINNSVYIFSFIILTLIIYYFSLKFKKKIKSADKLLSEYGNTVFAVKPKAVSFFLSLNIFQFILPRPPLVISGLLWIFAGILLLYLLHNRVEKKLFYNWLWILILNIIVFNSNLVLIATAFESWFILLVSIISVFTLFKIYKSSKEFLAAKKWLRITVRISLLIISFTVLINIIGYFNLTKLLLITFWSAIFISLMFYAIYIYINQILQVLSGITDENSGDRLSKSIQSLRFSLPKLAAWLLTAGGIILISRNFYIYDYFAEGLSIILQSERTIGNFTFKIESILLFAAITVISTLISKLISLYSEMKSSGLFVKKDERGGIGNWLLLIRIGVFTAGVLIAFASSGIPMDKLTIILGSLGVGIGLGLQSIVGNLFSGVFMAFEKPVKIGDQIEVDGKTGIIKEIGIRSSKLETFEGSDVIIPNGDLLTKHVINWTRKNNKRRAEILLNVNNREDINKYKALILKLLDENNNVEKIPPPQVLVNKLEDSEIEFRILFWCDVNNYLHIKSEVYYTIQSNLRSEENINGENKK